MLDRIRKYIEKHQLLNPDEKIIVGLSGGADSVALLFILKELSYNCIAAHCNFHLRGEESDRDEQFATQLTADWNISLFKKNFDTVSIASERKISIEMAARDLRYEWFEELRKEQNAQAVCVAHHRDDNVETLLINLMRGTGINGLTGMRPKNGFIVRPLLALSQDDVMQIISKHELPYVVDSSNLKDDFIRNRIRLQVLPLLRTINPSIDESIIQTMKNLKKTSMVYQDSIDRAKKHTFNTKENSISIPELMHFVSPEALLYELLKEFHFNSAVVQEVFQALDAQSGKEFYSPTHRLIKDRDLLFVTPLCEKQTDEFFLDKENALIHFPIKMEVVLQEKDAGFEISKKPEIACLDAGKLTFPLRLRHWKKGDRFIPFGMNQYQKLSDFFNNNKFSLQQKENTWLLTSGNDIVWIVGWRIDNRYKVTANTQSLLILKVF